MSLKSIQLILTIGVMENIYVIKFLEIVDFSAIVQSIVTALAVVYFTHKLREKAEDRSLFKKFVLREETYKKHKELLDKLTELFYQTSIRNDSDGYLQNNKKLLKQTERYLKMRFEEFKQECEKNDGWSDINKVRVFNEYLSSFRTMFPLIDDVSKLSNKKVRNICKEIVDLYKGHLSDEDICLEAVSDELPDTNPGRAQHYYNFQKTIYWEYFWVKIIKKLVILKNELDKFVALEK